jgi:hypothetical protein
MQREKGNTQRNRCSLPWTNEKSWILSLSSAIAGAQLSWLPSVWLVSLEDYDTVEFGRVGRPACCAVGACVWYFGAGEDVDSQPLPVDDRVEFTWWIER